MAGLAEVIVAKEVPLPYHRLPLKNLPEWWLNDRQPEIIADFAKRVVGFHAWVRCSIYFVHHY